MDEIQAITRLKGGNLSSINFLVNKYQVKAIHTAYLICGDAALAEDIAQTSFLRVIEKIGQFDIQREFSPWFFRIVVNLAVKTATRNVRIISFDISTDDNIQFWLNEKIPEPEDIAEIHDLQNKVWNALQQLPPQQRAVIVQKHFLEMKENEMAAKHRVSIFTIKWRLSEARKKLRVILAGEKK